VGIGGFHIGQKPTEDEAIRIVRTALDSGVNFLDNCWDYNDGRSEIRMGKALRDGYREKAFLMSKIDGHSKVAAARQIDESLQRLQTDHVDLMQFHEIIRPDDPEKVFGAKWFAGSHAGGPKSGAKCATSVFTGHKSPDIHLHMLELARTHGFHFDTVQMPLNVMDAHYASFTRKVLPVLVQEEIGVLGMKPIGSGKIMESKTVEAIECLHYAIESADECGHHRFVIPWPCWSKPSRPRALSSPMEEQEVAALLARTAPVATEG